MRFVGSSSSVKHPVLDKIAATQKGKLLEMEVHGNNLHVTDDAMPSGISMLMDKSTILDPTLITSDLFTVVAAAKLTTPPNTSVGAFVPEPAEQKLTISETYNTNGEREIAMWEPELSGKGAFAKLYSHADKATDATDYYVVVRSGLPESFVKELRQEARGKTWAEFANSFMAHNARDLAERNALRLMKEVADHYQAGMKCVDDIYAVQDVEINNGAVPEVAEPEILHHVGSLVSDDQGVHLNFDVLHRADLNKKSNILTHLREDSSIVNIFPVSRAMYNRQGSKQRTASARHTKVNSNRSRNKHRHDLWDEKEKEDKPRKMLKEVK